MAALATTAILDARFQDSTQPTFRTDASYVRVDVFPTLNGTPVSDLSQPDFEVLEDGRPQAITAFEHVVIRGGTPQELRAEPNTVAQSRALLQNPRARTFVIFLDTNHVTVEGSSNIRQPLINALDRMIGPDDIVGVMTPEMSAADVTFARRTTTIEGFLTKYWTWGQRDQLNSIDPVEEAYKACYPGIPTPCVDDRGIADEMIARRREKRSLDAVDDLIRYLATQRNERTAVLMISDGWLLYRPNQALARNLSCQGPPVPGVGIDPRTGRLTTDQAQPVLASNPVRCEGDRMSLAQLDDSAPFQTMLDRANRANISFYPIDPRGLTVFDSSLGAPRTGVRPAGQPATLPPAVDSANLQARLGTLRDLASATDGSAIINTNDLESGLRRITDDLSSYYLLGYYSTGKLDGKFHSIRVRVRRPGVQVRARRGYLALTAAEAAVPRPPSQPGVGPAALAATAALSSALSTLNTAARDAGIRLASATTRANQGASVWAVVEFDGSTTWRSGAEVDLTLTSLEGRTIATAHERVAPGARSFRTALTSVEPIAAGNYPVRLRATPSIPAAETVTEIMTVAVPAVGSSGVLMARRGPTTGNRELPTVDPRFRRTEQIRIDAAAGTVEGATARLLDRAGKPLAIPLTATVRVDPDGSRWITTGLSLAPLSVGDYLIEVTAGSGATSESSVSMVAFRIVP